MSKNNSYNSAKQPKQLKINLKKKNNTGNEPKTEKTGFPNLAFL